MAPDEAGARHPEDTRRSGRTRTDDNRIVGREIEEPKRARVFIGGHENIIGTRLGAGQSPQPVSQFLAHAIYK